MGRHAGSLYFVSVTAATCPASFTLTLRAALGEALPKPHATLELRAAGPLAAEARPSNSERLQSRCRCRCLAAGTPRRPLACRDRPPSCDLLLSMSQGALRPSGVAGELRAAPLGGGFGLGWPLFSASRCRDGPLRSVISVVRCKCESLRPSRFDRDCENGPWVHDCFNRQ